MLSHDVLELQVLKLDSILSLFKCDTNTISLNLSTLKTNLSQIPGISDRPGDLPDPFHTLFGVAGISLMNKQLPESKSLSSLGDINPVYCMPQTVLDRIGISLQTLSL